MLDWSQALLSPADAALLRRVSVFVTPFTAEAAAELAGRPVGAALDGLARLSEHSLIVPIPAADGTRYRLLEPIRQYGAEQLAQVDELAATGCAPSELVPGHRHRPHLRDRPAGGPGSTRSPTTCGPP